MKNNMKKGIVLSLVSSITTLLILNYTNIANVGLVDGTVITLLLTTIISVFLINKKIEASTELTKSNYWQLKNEIKAKISKSNGRRKKPQNKV